LKPFDYFDHTADVGLVARGRDLPELFQNAALGLMGLLADPATVQAGGIRERIEASCPDRDALLVAWLNQVLFLFSVQKMAFARFRVRSLTDTSVVAEGEGELLDPGRHSVLREVKSATFHGLKIAPVPGGFEARVVFDV
jgi:SHS2 domain-containing protein